MMLTIVLPVSGRKEFTKRFHEHVRGMPFKVISEVDPEQVSVERWRTKIYQLLTRVETPYAMIADNDDLPTLGLQRCVNFLEANPSFVCASGRIIGFHMWPSPVWGPHSAVTGQYSPYDTPAHYDQESVNDRVLAGFANSWSYYAVYRTAALQKIWEEVCVLGLTNLQIHEKFCAMRALTLGKATCFSYYTTYYRQHGTSHGPRWVAPNRDMHKVLVAMEALGVDRYELWTRWIEWYAARNRYFQGRWRKALKRRFPRLAWYYQNRYRYLPHKSLMGNEGAE